MTGMKDPSLPDRSGREVRHRREAPPLRCPEHHTGLSGTSAFKDFIEEEKGSEGDRRVGCIKGRPVE